MSASDRLLAVARELKELQAREHELVIERGLLVKELTASIGWKETELLLGVRHSRLSNMIGQALLKIATRDPHFCGQITSSHSNGRAVQ